VKNGPCEVFRRTSPWRPWSLRPLRGPFQTGTL
jgi:hypothetical protein